MMKKGLEGGQKNRSHAFNTLFFRKVFKQPSNSIIMELNTPIVKKGKLMKLGSSVVVAVPSEWLKDKDLEAGKEIVIVANGNLTIMKNENEINEKLRNQLAHAVRTGEQTE